MFIAVFKHKITHIINEQLVKFSQMQLFHISSIQIKKQYIINTLEAPNFFKCQGTIYSWACFWIVLGKINVTILNSPIYEGGLSLTKGSFVI